MNCSICRRELYGNGPKDEYGCPVHSSGTCAECTKRLKDNRENGGHYQDFWSERDGYWRNPGAGN